MFVHVPLLTRTVVSHNFGILTYEDNPISCVQAGGNGNMFFALAG